MQASIVGQIISTSLAIGPVGSLRTRALYSVINMRLSWSEKVTLTDDANCFFGKSVCPGIMASLFGLSREQHVLPTRMPVHLVIVAM